MILRGARWFDSEHKEFYEKQEIWIEDGLIKGTGKGFDKPGREVLDMAGFLVLPGWIDAHVHLTLSGSVDPIGDWNRDCAILTAIRVVGSFLGKYLASGVTVVRDLGGDGDVVLQLKKAVTDGIIVGPKIFTAGQALTMTGGHIHQISREVDGVDEARKAARIELKKGVDLLKVIATGGIITPGVEPGSPQLTEKEIRAVVEEAHKAGRKVAVHAEGYEGIQNALTAGVDTLEHGIGLGLQQVQMLHEQKRVLIPTLMAPRLIVRHKEELPEEMVKKAETVVEEHEYSFKLAYSKDCCIAVGTDAGTPFNLHGNYELELEELIASGMKIEDVLQAATWNAAVALGIESNYGSIKPDKVANLTIIEDNLTDKDWYRRKKTVMLKGHLLH